MGTVMYLCAYDPAVVDVLVDDPARLLPVVCGPDAWEADTRWWAALALALGPRAPLAALAGVPITDPVPGSPVMRVPADDVARLAGRVSGVGPQELANRFDAGALGERLAGPVGAEDREEVCASALELVDVVLRAWVDGHDLLWVVA